MAEFSVSALDLSLSPTAPPLKHPAFASSQELASAKKRRSRVVTRNNSTPNAWRTAGYVVYNENGENEGLSLQRGNSLSKSGRRSRPGGSGHFVRRGSGFYTHSTTASESESSLDPRRSGHWSASCNFLSTAGVPTPQIRRSNRHIYCHLPPDMENPNIKKRLRKSPSNDSGHSSSGGGGGGGGTSSGGTFPRIKATGRKRHGSSESASTTSSSSLGSLKERLEKTEPVLEPTIIKKRSSLASLISRKSSDKKSPSPALSNDEGIVSGPSSPTPQHEAASPKPNKSSSFSLKYVLRKSSSNSKLTHHEDHLKSFVGSNPHISMREDTEEELIAEDDNNKMAVAMAIAPPPPKPLRTYAMDNERIKEAVSSSSTLPLNASSSSKAGKLSKSDKSSTLPAKGKKGKDEAGSKTPTKKVFSKLFGKNKGQAKEKDQGSMANESKGGKKKSPSPDIVELESEPRKLVPRSDGKPRIVLTVAGRDFKDISEMEVSEEAVELAKKLRELQRQAGEQKSREEETKSLREVVVVGRNQQLSSSDPHEDYCDEETQGDTNKTGSRKYVRTNGRTMGCFGGSPPDETPKGRVGEIIADHQRYASSTSSSSPQTPGRSSDEDYSNNRNNSSCSRHEFESGIGHESPTSSLEDPLGSHNSNHHNDSHYGQYDEEDDEEETSMATTITTTASEMDASFMLSRSLALTEEDYSYTESFKQLKPFNFDHIDPIPQGKRERLYKVLVVGELGTGKTSIIKRYVHQFFSQHYRATIGVDFALKVLRWDPETVVRLQLWDIAGQERFGSMTRVYYKEAVGAFVVFDVTRAATLEAVPKWKADLDAKVVLPDGRPIPTVLLANKSDQPKEGIAANRDKMNEFCQQQGFSAWFQTSAKDNINIDESANFLVSKILEMDKWSQEPMASDPEKLDLSANGKARGGGDSNCAC